MRMMIVSKEKQDEGELVAEELEERVEQENLEDWVREEKGEMCMSCAHTPCLCMILKAELKIRLLKERKNCQDENRGERTEGEQRTPKSRSVPKTRNLTTEQAPLSKITNTDSARSLHQPLPP